MKKKNIIIGFLIFFLGFSLILIGLFFVSSYEEKTIVKKYDNLFDLANEMYEDNTYTELPKNSSGAYYMTIGEYKKRKYNLDLIDSTCPDSFGIIYFDVENKEDYNKNPIYVVKHCKSDLDSSTSLLELAKQIYLKNEYTDLPMDDGGGYYMTVGEYKLRGYNLELIDSTCSDDSNLIYFDIANKDKYDDAAVPVFVSDYCE